MRTRQEIEKESKCKLFTSSNIVNTERLRLILEVLLDIRELLMEKK